MSMNNHDGELGFYFFSPSFYSFLPLGGMVPHGVGAGLLDKLLEKGLFQQNVLGPFCLGECSYGVVMPH